MTQDEFVALLRKQAGAPEADSLAEKTLMTAWRMSQAGDSESIKNAENILNFATVDPAIKNIVKQQFQQVTPTAVPEPVGNTASTPTTIEATDASVEVPIVIPTDEVMEKQTELSVETPIELTEIPNTEEPSEVFSIPSDSQEIPEALPLDTPTQTTPIETVQIESVPVVVDPVATILTQSSITTPVTQTQKKETHDDLISKILADTQDRKLSRTEELEQLIKQTKQEEIKKDVELEKPQAVIHTYDTTAEEESQLKFHSVEDRVKADKAEPFFSRCEEYLKKAYENGSSSIITSAENQFASLKNRFPEFVELYPDRITKIESLKTEKASTELESITISGVLVKKGMTITSSHVYEVENILKQGMITMIHFSDETLQNYNLSSTDLERGLETPGIDADVFFDEFRVN